MPVLHLTDDTFDEAIENNKLLFVDMFADWCAPCRMMAPVVEELAKQYEGRVAFAKLDVDANKRVPEEYEVISIPTLFVFKDGKVAERIVGAVPKKRIEDALKKYL
jgi:thioredoxin 1